MTYLCVETGFHYRVNADFNEMYLEYANPKRNSKMWRKSKITLNMLPIYLKSRVFILLFDDESLENK